MRILAGILTIVGGWLGGSLWFYFSGLLVGYFALTLAPLDPGRASEISVPVGFLSALIRILPMFLAVIGGIYALKRKHWRWALAGAICSLLFPFMGIPALILLIKSKGEFV